MNSMCRRGKGNELFGFLGNSKYDADNIEFSLKLQALYDAGCEQIITDYLSLLRSPGAGDVLILPCFSEIGKASFDMWPEIFALYKREVIVRTLEPGFFSALPDDDKVIQSVFTAVLGARDFLTRKPV